MHVQPALFNNFLDRIHIIFFHLTLPKTCKIVFVRLILYNENVATEEQNASVISVMFRSQNLIRESVYLPAFRETGKLVQQIIN